MKEIKGKYATAKVFASVLDETTEKQIQTLVDSKISENSKIRIQADCHAGAGCVIGTTMIIKDKVCPNLVGVDIGCGMLMYQLGKVKIDLGKLDNFIKKNIPSGRKIHDSPIEIDKKLGDIICPINIENANCSIGTLGGGNHFIEIDKDDRENKYLIVHTGSRHLGLEVAKYYQKLAEKECSKNKKKELIDKLKSQGRQREIQKELSKIETIPKGLEYLTGQNMKDYLYDMEIVQDFADTNRCGIVSKIILYLDMCYSGFKFNNNVIKSIHNYIDTDSMILRKGSISALDGEYSIIPINMKDGSLICKGKGNQDYNYSAPHGSGRVMSRSQAFKNIKLSDFKESMSGIYSSCIQDSTLDESPFVYKSLEDILPNIQDTVTVVKHIKPIYNFKATE